MNQLHRAVALLAELHTETGHLTALRSILEQADVEVRTVEHLSAASAPGNKWLGHFTRELSPAAIILSVDQRAIASDELSALLTALLPARVPILIAAQNFEAPQIQRLLELGVADFITPPFTSAAVLPRFWRLVKPASSDSSIQNNIREKIGIQRFDLLGKSPAFLDEVRKLPMVARCDVTVMIAGETGTGKELIARAIHYLSQRRDSPFVPIDCGAIPPEIAESELFGHERGAFTGAVARNPGLIASADQGTLFLDEVDGLTLSVQAKLLRFLQQREYRSIGSNKVKRADVRVISATNQNLQQRVRTGEFREDLYYRLMVVHLRLPALRQRHEDVVLLARHFVVKYAARFKRQARDFSPEALQCLLMHTWPGNIRELENVVAAAVALCDGPLIGVADLLITDDRSKPLISFQEAKARTINEFERDYLMRLLYACGGNISEAARAAGKNRRAFWELMRKHGVNPDELRNQSADREASAPLVRAAKASARQVSSD